MLWVDADITSMPRHTLSTLVDSGKDVVTTITKGWGTRARLGATSLQQPVLPLEVAWHATPVLLHVRCVVCRLTACASHATYGGNCRAGGMECGRARLLAGEPEGLRE